MQGVVIFSGDASEDVVIGSKNMEQELEKAAASGMRLKIIFKPTFNEFTMTALNSLSEMLVSGRTFFPFETDIQKMSAASRDKRWFDKSEKARSIVVELNRQTFQPKVFMLAVEPAIQGVIPVILL